MSEDELKLDQLPDNILKNIICLTEEEDDGNIRLVCQKMKNIFDGTVGLCWGKHRDIMNNAEIEKFEWFPSCRELYLQSRYVEKTPAALPRLKQKHLLHNIHVNTWVTNSSMNRTFTGLTSLKTLGVYYTGLKSLKGNIYLNDLVNLNKLKLEVSALSPDCESLYFVLINFLKIATFPCLKKLSIHIEDCSCENMFCDALLKFLIQHKKSITRLKLIVWGMTQGEDWPALPDFHEQLNELENHQLVKVQLINYCHCNQTMLAQVFEKIITTGNMIEEANECRYFAWYDDPNDPDDTQRFYCENPHATLRRIPRQMIENNCSTLVNIGFNILPEDCRPLDCSVFVPCTSLKELRLFTRLNSDAELTNAAVLPQSLDTFEILHFKMKSEEIHSIATNNMNLKSVYFGHTGTENGCGVKLESFTCFTARRTEEIFIINSWNSADVNESLHNRGPFHRMQALALLETKKILVKQEYSRVTRRLRKRAKRAKVMIHPIKLVELGITAMDSGIYEYNNN